jgi:uncharacterized delta-60 repeat protein
MPLLQARGAASAQGFGLFSAIADKYWMGTLEGGPYDAANAIAIDSAGNVYVAGDSNASGTLRIQLAKYNASGVIQWQRNLNPSNNGYAIAVDSSSNVYIAGVGNGTVTQIAKYDTSGTILWQRKLTDAGSSYAYGIALDSSANVYVSGNMYTSGSQAIFVAKYDTSGTIQWQRVLQNTDAGVTDQGRGVAVDSSGNVYIAGFGPPVDFSPEYQAYLIKYDTSGTLQWQRKLHGATNAKDYGYAVAVDSSSNVYVVGESDNNNIGGISDGLIAKYNSSGTIQWQRRLGNTQGASRMNSVAVDSSSNIYICGTTSFNGPDQILLAKYDTSGTIQWQRNIDNSTRMRGFGITTSSNNVYVAGYILNSSNVGFFIAKLPNDGSLTGTYTVDGVSIIYAVTTKTDATSTLSAGTASLAASTGIATDSATTATNTTTSLTSSVTTL